MYQTFLLSNPSHNSQTRDNALTSSTTSFTFIASEAGEPDLLPEIFKYSSMKLDVPQGCFKFDLFREEFIKINAVENELISV